MRSSPADYELLSPGSLQSVLTLLQREPGQWTPIAGGTEIMVLFSAGKLSAHKLVNIANLPELCAITETEDTLSIGAGCTYTQLRKSAAVGRHFPMLARAASWTGSIANQNRGTLGGNLVNASPAADSPPALLAYDAEVELISVRGGRRLPYSKFHLGYKRTALAADELLLAIHLPKRRDKYFSYTRKVGARNAQAISKVCVAAVGLLADGRVSDVRIGMGSVAPVPMRLIATEQCLAGQTLDDSAIAKAKLALEGEIAPIDDIRSVAVYRTQVAKNLLEEFLRGLAASEAQP